MVNQVLALGGILPLAQGCPDTASELAAVTFDYQGRSIVRLVASELTLAEELAVGSFGLRREATVVVGASLQRAVGFPAWPIIHDPENARHALNLVGDLEWARRNARNQAKKVKERFDALTAALTASAPHFVPTFLEELSRIFASVDNVQYAKQYFSKAREIERGYGIPIDAERHRAVFLEFAIAGVLAARELTTETNAALARFEDPKDAFDYLLDINTERVRAGVEPYAYMVRDLRKAGKAAGMKPAEVDVAILDAVLDLKATKQAPEAFWKAIRPALVRYAQQRPAAREALLAGKPREFDVAAYVQLLEESGCLSELRQDRPKHAAWVIGVINEYSGFMTDEAGWVQAEVAFAGEYIKDRTVTAVLGWLPLSLIDVLVEHGADIPKPEEQGWRGSPDWDYWLEDQFAPCRRPLDFVVGHPMLRELFVQAIEPADVHGYLDLFLEHSGARELLLAKLDWYIEQRAEAVGSVPKLGEFVADHAECFASPKLKAVAGARIDALFAFDAAAEFQEAVRRGVFTEYTWPAFEQAMVRVRERSGRKAVSVFETYPAVAVAGGDYVEVIDGDGVLATGELPAQDDRVSAVRNVGEDVVVVFRPKNVWREHVFWLGDVTSHEVGYIPGGMARYSLPVPGGRLTAHGLITPGESSFGSDSGAVFATDPGGVPALANKYQWQDLPETQWDGTHMHQWSGGPGTVFDTLRLESFGIELSEPWAVTELCLSESVIIPAQPTTQSSPLGVVDGVHVSVTVGHGHTYRIISALGTFETKRQYTCVLRRPGGGFWLANQTSLVDLATEQPIASAKNLRSEKVSIESLPEAAWHQLRPRDEQASSVMRRFTREQARQVMDAVRPAASTSTGGEGVMHRFLQTMQSAIADLNVVLSGNVPGHGGSAEDVATVRGVLARQLGTQDPEFLDPIVEIAFTIEACGGRLRELQAAASASAAQPVTDAVAATPIAEDSLLITPAATSIFETIYTRSWRPDSHQISNMLRRIYALRQGRRDWVPSNAQGFESKWLEFSGNERVLLGFVGSPLFSKVHGADATREFLAFLRTATEWGAFGHGWRLVSVALPDKEETSEEHREIETLGGCFLLEYGNVWDNGARQRIAWVWAPANIGDRLGPYPVTRPDTEYALEAGAFLVALDAIERHLDQRELAPQTVEAIAAGTQLTPEGVMYLFGGMRGLRNWEAAFLSTEERAAYGFGAADAKAARTQVRVFDSSVNGLLAAAVGDDPVGFVQRGPDVQAVVEFWQRNIGPVELRLTNAEYNQLVVASPYSFREIAPGVFKDPAERSFDRNGEIARAVSLLTFLIWLGQHRLYNDPSRPLIARRIEALCEGLTGAWEALPAEARTKHYAAEFGSEYAKLARPDMDYYSARLVAEGFLDALVADLHHVHEQAGDGHDPAVSAPDTLADAARHLGVGIDAARYYLQLLAFMQPTDANIRAWNGWRKKDIDQASSELLERGLIVEAARTGAGRKRFLPGGWLLGSTGNKPVEVWKAPHYMLWQDAVVRPVIGMGLPLVPFKQLFSDAWQRYVAGDVPGYEELKTTRYRARRR